MYIIIIVVVMIVLVINVVFVIVINRCLRICCCSLPTQAIAKGICDHYQSLGEEDKAVLLTLLAAHLRVEHQSIARQAAEMVTLYSQEVSQNHEWELLVCWEGWAIN